MSSAGRRNEVEEDLSMKSSLYTYDSVIELPLTLPLLQGRYITSSPERPESMCSVLLRR